MIPALSISKTGLQAQDAELNAIANNLANANTNGFKSDRVVFADLFYQIERQPGVQADANNMSPSGVQIGNGSRIVGTQKNFFTGAAINTGNPLDVMITGRGFFQVEKPDGETAYTRVGAFQLNSDGTIVTAQGLPLLPNIQVPENATNVTVGEDGTVTATLAGQSEGTVIGQITLVNFINPQGLVAQGDNLYLESDASGNPTEGVAGEDGLGKTISGQLEGSNVNVVEQMVDMIAAQRAYEMNTKVMSAADGMMQYLTQNL